MSCDRENAWMSKKENSNWKVIESLTVASRGDWRKKENVLRFLAGLEHVFNW